MFTQTYNVFRRDRPTNFATDTGVSKVGRGGILIGVRGDLDVES